MSGGRPRCRARIALLAGAMALGALAPRGAFAAERPRFGGTVVLAGEHQLGVDLAPSELTTPIGRTAARALYSTLFRVDADGRVLPHLAVRSRPERDGREWRMEIDPGARFHDGSPVRPADVVATLERWARTSPGGAEGCLAELGKDPERARAVAEPGVVRVLLVDPCPGLDVELADPAAGVLPEHLARGEGAIEHPVGSGPFRLAERDGERVGVDAGGGLVLEAFGDHFQGRPFLDRVVLRGRLPAAERTTELRIGTLDVALGAGRESRDGATWTDGGASTVFLVANPASVPAATRVEIAGTVDRDLIAEVILGGRASRADTPIPPSRVPFGPLLPRIGTSAGAAPDRPQGTMELAVALEDASLDLVAQRLQADLEAAGLGVRLTRPPRDQLAWSMRSGGFVLAVVERALPDGPSLASFGRVIRTWRPSPGERAVALAADAGRARSLATGLESLVLAERAVVEDAVWIPVVHRDLGASHSPQVRVGRVCPDGSLELESVWRRAP